MLTTNFVETCWDLLRLPGCWDQFLLIFFCCYSVRLFFQNKNKVKTNMADFRLFQANLLIFLKSNFDEVWIVRKKLLKRKLFIQVISLVSHSFTPEMWFVCRKECPISQYKLAWLSKFWSIFIECGNCIFRKNHSIQDIV